MRIFILSLIPVIMLVCVAVTSGQSEPLPGKVPFERVCAACHGATAQGDQGPRLVPMTLEYEELLAKVRQGGGEMPVISKAKMSDDEVKQVYEYLKSL